MAGGSPSGRTRAEFWPDESSRCRGSADVLHGPGVGRPPPLAHLPSPCAWSPLGRVRGSAYQNYVLRVTHPVVVLKSERIRGLKDLSRGGPESRTFPSKVTRGLHPAPSLTNTFHGSCAAGAPPSSLPRGFPRFFGVCMYWYELIPLRYEMTIVGMMTYQGV